MCISGHLTIWTCDNAGHPQKYLLHRDIYFSYMLINNTLAHSELINHNYVIGSDRRIMSNFARWLNYCAQPPGTHNFKAVMATGETRHGDSSIIALYLLKFSHPTHCWCGRGNTGRTHS